MPSEHLNEFVAIEEIVAIHRQEEVAEVVQQAVWHGRAVYPIGGGSHLALGARGSRPGVALRIAPLNRLVDYPHRDLTVTIEAGMTLSHLQEILSRENQWLPVSAPNPDQATIGGIVSTAWPGPREARYGTIADFLLGCRAVDGLGRMFTCGAKVVKNAAGYNLPRLLAGAFGGLAVITEVTLMVRPRPEQSAMLVAPITSWEKAEEALAALGPRCSEVAAAEILLGPYWAKGLASFPQLASDSTAQWLAIALEGSSHQVSALGSEICEVLRREALSEVCTIAPDEIPEMWRRLEAFAGDRFLAGADEKTDGNRGYVLIQGHVLPGELIGVVGGLAKFPQVVAAQAHAARGIIRAWVECPCDTWWSTVSEIRRQFHRLGRTAIIACRPASWDIPVNFLWDVDLKETAATPGLRERHQIMRRLRNLFDPHGILNPGRLPWT